MTKDKQIEEIDNLTSVIWEANHKRSVLDYHWLATEVHNANYRLASEVAREIFEEIERYVIKDIEVHGEKLTLFNGRNYAELKKKYTEE